MKLNRLINLAVASGLFITAGHSLADGPSADQMQQIQQLQILLLQERLKSLRLQNGNINPAVMPQLFQGSQSMPQGAQMQSLPTSQSLVSEVDIGKQIEALGPSNGGIEVIRHKDGFSIDGMRYVDPEGQIDRYAFDALNGDVTYVVVGMQNQYKIKTMRARSNMEAVTIATATHNNGTWQITTLSGKTLSGSRIMPLSRGIIVARDNVAFRYIPGKGVSNIVGPDGFSFTAFQNGDIEGTGYIMMERIQESDASSGDNVIGHLKSLGSLLGVGKKEDYLLLNINNNRSIPVNISMEGKEVQLLSQCRKKNFAYSYCDRMDSFESLFDPKDGRPNLTHYYWRVSWFKTQAGPVLVSQEGGLGEIIATNLNSGAKASLFKRALGIAGYSTKQGADGKVGVTAQMGFTKESIDDVVAFMNKPEALERTVAVAAPASASKSTTESFPDFGSW